MRHNDDERKRITLALAEENRQRNSTSLHPIKEDPSNTNEEKDEESIDPKPCFPCIPCLPNLSDPRPGCWGKRQKEFLKVRIVFRKIVENKWFDNGILILIVASSSVLVSAFS